MHTWHEIIPGTDMSLLSPEQLVVEVRAIHLADQWDVDVDDVGQAAVDQPARWRRALVRLGQLLGGPR